MDPRDFAFEVTKRIDSVEKIIVPHDKWSPGKFGEIDCQMRGVSVAAAKAQGGSWLRSKKSLCPSCSLGDRFLLYPLKFRRSIPRSTLSTARDTAVTDSLDALRPKEYANTSEVIHLLEADRESPWSEIK